MDDHDRLTEFFGRFATNVHESRDRMPLAARMAYYIMATRSQIDVGGFASVFEQLWGPDDRRFLIDTLEQLGEPQLAAEFRWCHELLAGTAGFVTPSVRAEVDEVGKRVGERLWELDAKLLVLLADDDER